MTGLLVAWQSTTPPYFCYWTLLERCNTLIPDVLPDETAKLRWESNLGRVFESPI